jgi:hypothetical protein
MPRAVHPHRSGKTKEKVPLEAAPLSKFQRYRQHQAERGMKLLRLWVRDPARPGFAEEAKRQAQMLNNRPEEREALTFIDQAFAWPDE